MESVRNNGANHQIQQTFSFHQRCGRCITLQNGNRTARRSILDFTRALVFSGETLIDDVLFEVVIEKKYNTQYSIGSIEIGVTSESPDELELAACVSAMRNGTWVMSASGLRKDGRIIIDYYGPDLEKLKENDRIGVMRTSNHELVFYVNGESQGVAALNIPKKLWALVDLYGRCLQISICPTSVTTREQYNSDRGPQIMQSLDIPMSVDVSVDTTNSHLNGSDIDSRLTVSSTNSMHVMHSLSLRSTATSSSGDFYDMNDSLRFHTRCGSLVKLSPNFRSAERRSPLDEFNNGVVMTHRPLRDNELFEIRIDKLVDKWSGSIEVGVTTHNPTVLHFPATMTNMRSGTIMMSGCGILTNGKGTRRQYGEFNLDELREGDRVGMMRKGNASLHYYINGRDQGVAATRVAALLWGVIDLYGMTIKVTIVDRDEREQQNLVTRRIVTGLSLTGQNANPTLSVLSPESDLNMSVGAVGGVSELRSIKNDDRLTFHPTCGTHATVTQSGRTALRPNASDDFNNGVVLTRRPLRPNEMFQVRLERVVTKWAGSVEMGVTTHSAEELDFPFTMTNVRSGTWMMTGNGVMQNGVTVIERYGQNLDRLQVGDRVGVVRKDDGTLHFWVNGIDQGPAAANVPERVFGVIDLYGQAAQASIIDACDCESPDTGNSTISNTTLYSDIPLRFHAVHGTNVGISNGGITASRPNSLAEFNDAIVFSNRPLRNRELFEVELESMARNWSGNIEIGVTGTRPEDINLAPNATDLEANDTIILCGPMVFHNRKTIRTNMVVDLDTLGAGTRVGVMRNGDYIHFFIDGVDQGAACECRAPNIWAIVDLYGQSAQVSLTQTQCDVRAPYATSENSQSCQATSVIHPAMLETRHRWTCVTGSVTLSDDWTHASRPPGTTAPLSQCLIFSEHPLTVGSPFEIKITSINSLFSGCLSIGITDLNLTDENVRKKLPLGMKLIPANVWYVTGNEVRHNMKFLHRSMASLEWLRLDDHITLELTSARTLRILLNSEDMNIKFSNIPNRDVYVVAELKGTTMAVQAISSQGPTSPLRPCSLRLQDSLDFGVDPMNKQDSMLESIDSEAQNYEFSEIVGKNIRISDDHRSATRFKSYNNALVCLSKPLCKGDSVSIKVDALNNKWKGCLGVGVLGIGPQQSANGFQLPATVINCKRPCWVATEDFININGQVIASRYGEVLEQIQVGTVITVTLTHASSLFITVGSTSLEDLATGLPAHVYPVFDVYGKCEKISLVMGSDAARNGTPIIEAPEALEMDNSLPQCEKANLEMHEKEKDIPHATNNMNPNREPIASTSSNAMTRSVMESVSENLLLNISIKNRSMEQQNRNPEPTTTTCCLRESLQLQHNTNLNIQRSQSTQRFLNASAAAQGGAAASGVYDTNKDPCESGGHGRGDAEHCNNRSQHEYNDENNLALQQMHASGSNEASASGLTEAQNFIDSNQLENDIDNMNYLMLLQELQQNEYVRMQNHLMRIQISSLIMDVSGLSAIDFDNSLRLDAVMTPQPITCEYMKIVTNFMNSLVLPQPFFHRRMEPICFCPKCCGNASDKLENWVYFKLNQQTVNCTAVQTPQVLLDFSGDWLPFYYMTRVDKIRAILDRGQPVPLDCDTYSTSYNQKDEPGPKLELYYSPNANIRENVTSHHHYVCESGTYTISTGFEVYVRRHSISGSSAKTELDHNCEMPSLDGPGTSAMQQRNRPSNILDNNTANITNSSDIFKDMCWFTKEAGACIINALILRLDKIDVPQASPNGGPN